MKNPRSIRALFAFPGFTAASKLVGVFGDRYARVIQLRRRKKRPSVRTVDTAAGDVTTTHSSIHIAATQVQTAEFLLTARSRMYWT